MTNDKRSMAAETWETEGAKIGETACSHLRTYFVIRHSVLVIWRKSILCTHRCVWPGSLEEKRGCASALLIFPRFNRGWNWHLDAPMRFGAGCRGFVGPVPQPLNMRPLYQRIRIH